MFVGCGSQANGSDLGPPRPVSQAADALLWAPPRLSQPTTVKVGQGYTDVRLDPTRDYVVELPSAQKIGGLTLEGGHNIVLIGGYITVPAESTSSTSATRRAIYIKGATGTVHVEGVLLNAVPGAMWDGVDIDAPAATVQLENIRIEGVNGALRAFHGDAVQPWGGVKDLRVDRLSATSDYQGLTIPIDQGPIERTELDEVDLVGEGGEGQGGGHLLWLTSGTASCQAYDVSLTSVYVRPRRARKLWDSIWPQARLRKPCAAHVRHRVASWPGLRTVRGHVIEGSPPHGSYVPRSEVGPDYVSPGYLG